MKKYVRIHSNTNIRVTPGLQYEDVTKRDSDLQDRLKVNPLWPTAIVYIYKGSYLYPSEIAEWETVKALAKDKILTIGEFTDTEEGDVEAKKENLELNLKKIKSKETSATKKETTKKEVSLDELVKD